MMVDKSEAEQHCSSRYNGSRVPTLVLRVGLRPAFRSGDWLLVES